MTVIPLPHRFSAALALVLAATSAHADLTAADVWGDWRDYLNGFGYAVTGTESMSGNVLTVSDVTMDMKMPENGGNVAFQIGTLSFTENGDGTVAIGLPASMPVTVTTVPESGETVTMTMAYSHDGLDMVASGTPTELRYAYSARSIDMALTGMTVNGAAVPPADAVMSVSLRDISGTSDMTIADLRTYTQDFTASGVSYNMDFAEPGQSNRAKITGSMGILTLAGTGQVPLGMTEPGDMAAMLDAGFGIDGTINYQTGTMQITANGPDGPLEASTSTEGGALKVAMSANGLTYDARQTGLKVDATAAAAPLPISFMVRNSAFNLSMPLKKSDTAGDFAFGFTLGDFTMSDMLWGLFDPTAQLPRDPATLALDLTGKARLLFDFLDPSAAVVSGDPNVTPAEVESVDIHRIQVTVAGAELTGNGAFTFDNTQALNGMPKPTGAADFRLVGGNGLLDKLVAMGLIPEDEAMGMRMMLGLFARPGDGEDTLVSKIEVNAEGQVLANGQRLR